MMNAADNQDAYQLGQAMARAGRERIGCGDPDCAHCEILRDSFFMGYDDFKANPTAEQKTA